MGQIHVHEFISLDGVIDAPIWTADFGFDPGMAEVLGKVTGNADAILLGRVTYEMFEPAWSTRTVEDDPGAPFFNDTPKHVVSSTLSEATWRNSPILGPYDADAIRALKDATRRGHLRQRQRHARTGDARRRPDRRPAPVRLPRHARVGPAAVPRGQRGAKARAHGVRGLRQRRHVLRAPAVAGCRAQSPSSRSLTPAMSATRVRAGPARTVSHSKRRWARSRIASPVESQKLTARRSMKSGVAGSDARSSSSSRAALAMSSSPRAISQTASPRISRASSKPASTVGAAANWCPLCHSHAPCDCPSAQNVTRSG